jgi:hypothetical protein
MCFKKTAWFGLILGPLLYILFTSDPPQAPNVTIGNFSDDTAILISHTHVLRASTTLQEYLHIFNRWLQKWKIKINETKSSYLTFTLLKDQLMHLFKHFHIHIKTPERLLKNVP